VVAGRSGERSARYPRPRRSPVRRLAAELLVSATATAVMVALVLVVGTAVAQPAAQGVDGSEGDRRGCLDAPLAAISDSGVEGDARLCVDRDGVRSMLRLGRLTPGEVYAAWLVYFDDPSGCFHRPCALIDLRGDDPVGVLGRIDGAIAPPTRALELSAHLRDLHPSRGAQITLLLVNHGGESEADGRARARQLLTPRMPELGAPIAGANADRGRGSLHAQAIFAIR
jgi:hypothetical protein